MRKERFPHAEIKSGQSLSTVVKSGQFLKLSEPPSLDVQVT